MSQSGKITHPLGNRHHGRTALRPAQISCYKAQLELDAKNFAAVSPVTGILKRFMICCDKGTVKDDATRQVIVASYFGKNVLL